ncbi:hypothetical protein ACJMK2_010373 [Sinanodonta woodiana]|uniref:Dihydroorotate dehydrogenase (quinone), mitochondrial n=1 Tax=Sinanodonta woodiana TaxID=1069815 RepID=A0ABD3VF74_SINWO
MSATSKYAGLIKKLKDTVIIASAGTLCFVSYSIYEGNEKFYRQFVMPAIHMLDAETSHKLAVKAAKYKLIVKSKEPDPEILHTKVWGRTFSNPVGLAAGFDKDGEAVDGLLRMGFGFVEVGSVTPLAQPGNPKPRVFRLLEDKGVINRYGFNSEGHDAVYERLKVREAETSVAEMISFPQMGEARNMLNINLWTETTCDYSDVRKKKVDGIVGVNLGKNKTSENAVGDYVKGVRKFGKVADYLVINVSSPNTPGLRDMQGKENLDNLLDKVSQARNLLQTEKKPPLLVKIAPDLTDEDKQDIASVITKKEGYIDGLIISNTTVSRPATLHSPQKVETGGLSGQPLKELSTKTVQDMYVLTKGRIPIIGVGGISSGEDAYKKIRAGASLIQLYTALIYEGPPVIKRIKRELEQLLKQDGYNNVSEAVGADVKNNVSRSNPEKTQHP